MLSGSLAWLFNHYDGMRPFSALVRQARDAGYTEPDPRDDLSGEDVRRKLLILARTAGVELDADQVDVASLVPPELAILSREALDAALPALDAPLRERYAEAYKRGEKLRFIARLQDSIDLSTLLAGLIKAPFMAMIIGIIGSIEGMQVGGSAESLGRHVTASVVKSIFIVIVVDGLFAMFYAAIDF